MKNILITIGILLLLGVVANIFNVFNIDLFKQSKEVVVNQTSTDVYLSKNFQDLIKLYNNWTIADEDEKLIIEAKVRINYNEFDEEKIKDFPPFYGFLKTIKNK